RLSEGRFSFGLGLGGRPSDFAVAPEEWPRRGERFERQLIAMKRCWQGLPPFDGTEPVGPPPYTPGGPEVIIGGMTPRALERAGRLADGIRSFSFSTDVAEHLQRYAVTRDAWVAAGRAGRPKLIAATHFALGPDARETYEAHVAGYYGYDRELVATALAGDSPTSPDAILSTVARFEEAGVDELVFTATTADSIDSISRLAEVISARGPLGPTG
ncbi:MAG TPA: LLM class flavin-dependent oxidoreductase, partial [Acidimicrobiales bacterium]|nr:LLM class flavin-dependent oxidoreductase [Acidimicrobiales bacterium]